MVSYYDVYWAKCAYQNVKSGSNTQEYLLQKKPTACKEIQSWLVEMQLAAAFGRQQHPKLVILYKVLQKDP